MGDFTGFTFGGYASSDLGITRVSGGDRYDEELHPEIKDRTAEIPGLNGQYYFGSDYGPRKFDIEFAFDHLTEEQFRKLRQVFGTKKIQQLIFDERPYKYYMAKIESPIELSYVCFNEQDYDWDKIELGINPQTGLMDYVQGVSGDFEYKKYNDKFRRIYKGEGKITFICHFPFAKSMFKVLPNEDSGWAVSSGILSTDQYNTANIDKNIPHPTEDNVRHIHIYNPGDFETGFRLYCPFNENERDSTYSSQMSIAYFLQIGGTWVEQARLKFNPITPITEQEIGFLVDSNTGLVTGVSSFSYDGNGNENYTTNGQLYNKFIKAGSFFKIQPTNFNDVNEGLIAIVNGNEDIEIFYDYLYF